MRPGSGAWVGSVGAVLGGLLLWVNLPGAPRPLGGLSALFALVPLLLLCRQPSARRAFWHSYLLLAIYYLCADSWLWLHFPLVYPFKAAGSAAVALVGVWLIRRLARSLPLPIAAGLGWAAGEWLRAHLPELPYPHHQLAHSLYDRSWFLGSASLWGEVGLNFLAAACSGALAGLWSAWREARPPFRRGLVWGGTILLLLGGNALLSHGLLAAVESFPGPEVGLVQGNRPVTRLASVRSPTGDFESYLHLTRRLCREQDFDLVAWPESTLPLPVLRGFGERRPVDMAGRVHGSPAELARAEALFFRRVAGACRLRPGGGVVLGGSLGRPEAGDPGLLRVANAGFLLNTQGRLQGWVVKRNLVPGGEFLPLLRRLPFGLGLALERWGSRHGIPVLAPGGGPRTVLRPRTGRFGVAICYDNAFQDFFAAAVREGAGWHLVISNEAWYGEGAELDQMVAMTALYAAATRRSILRCTNSGISCLVSPRGKIGPVLRREGRDREVAGTLAVRVPLARGETPLSRISGWPGLAVLLVSFLLALRRRGGPRRWDDSGETAPAPGKGGPGTD